MGSVHLMSAKVLTLSQQYRKGCRAQGGGGRISLKGTLGYNTINCETVEKQKLLCFVEVRSR